MKGQFPLDRFAQYETPFYYYDTRLLRETLEKIQAKAKQYNYQIHYAIKANANQHLLTIIREHGFGADCVSGGEIKAAMDAGFEPSTIVYAGVGKADWEINLGLSANIFCFNVESIAELEIINELAKAQGKVASVALRINPEVKADTHHYITTGLKENKFGIALSSLNDVIDCLQTMDNVQLKGLHFHIGSQILEMDNFRSLCVRINEIQEDLYQRHIIVDIINVGGGLGIDYQHPNRQSVPDFDTYFETFHRHLKLRPSQRLHFELGRSVVAQCGSLITRVLYVKQGVNKKFAIVDGGMTELIRPALYQAYHKIENLSSDGQVISYDVVGPICESSDCFGKEVQLNEVHRGDFVALRSAGAYGEIMASQYNCRKLPQAYYSDEFVSK